MRILHVWCQAGVSGLLAKYQRRLGHTVIVVKRYGLEGLGQGDFYNITFLGVPKQTKQNLSKKVYSLLPSWVRSKIRNHIIKKLRSVHFYIKTVCLARHFDIIHIHGHHFVGLLIPFRKKIYLFHGDDVRHNPHLRSKFRLFLMDIYLRCFCYGNNFYVSTPDLLKDVPHSQYMPNPVDTEHFNGQSYAPTRNYALYLHNWYETPKKAKQTAEQHGLELKILERTKGEVIPYANMPRYLANFEYFIDRHAIKSLSKTALESLAVGLKVIRFDGKILRGLTPIHYPEIVARAWIETYKEKLKP